MSILVFGLARYYAIDNRSSHSDQNKVSDIVHQNGINFNTNLPLKVSNLVFIIIYSITLIVTGLFSDPDQDLFIPWTQFSSDQLVLLISSILLCFFLPGYAVIDLLDHKKHELKPLLKVLLAYVFSIAIIGFGGYISASIELPPSDIKLVLLGLFAAILGIYIVTNCTKGLGILPLNYFQNFNKSINKNSSEVIVFGSLLAFVVLSTYSLYQGIIIGDEWFHHGRALSFLGDGYRTQVDNTLYPAFFHGVLASFFSLSGIPTVNAYSSISFLNIIPVFAFYYFFRKWIPSGNASPWRNASLLACAFFMLSSGFGWVNMISMSASTNPVFSSHSSAELFRLVEARTLDINRAGSFIITSSPQIGTSLTLISLPLGFVLLGLVKERISSRLKYAAVIGTISTVGILSHDEFYLFIIVACVLPLIFKLPEGKSIIYLTFLCSMVIIVCLDITLNAEFSTVQYYTVQDINGVPIIFLTILFVGLMWSLYVSGMIRRLMAILGIIGRSFTKVQATQRRSKYLVGIAIVAVTAYMYIFTFLVWGQLSGEEIQLQQVPYDLPWYLYPMKLGITGLLGISFILSYFFKKFERDIIIFGLIAVIALFFGPYYDEYRFSKYVMVAMGAFAALFITRIINSMKISRPKFLFVGLIIGTIVTSSSLSVLMFNGYIASALERQDFKEFSVLLRNKVFPTPQDFKFLNFLHKNVNFEKDHIIVALDYGGPGSKPQLFKDQKLAQKIQGFVGTPLISPSKILKNPYTLNSTSMVGLYTLLNSDNIRYIVLPKENNFFGKIKLPVEFALENFERRYQDENYVVLTVPTNVPPSSTIDGVALVYKPEGIVVSSTVSGKKLLNLSNDSFKEMGTPDSANRSNNLNHTSTIFNGDKRSTLWSNLLEQKDINYLQTKLRVVGNNDSLVGSSGIVFRSNDKEYQVSLNKKGLQISENDGKLGKDVLMSQDQNVIKENYTWYDLKVLTSGNNIAIYLDDMLKLQVPVDPPQNLNISKVGIRIDHNTAETEPITVGHIRSAGSLLKKELYYNLYYPLSELALSKAAYNTFVNGDTSALSHKIVMLTWDPASNDTQFRDYLRYLNDGGTIVVINSRDNFAGGFSKLLNVTTGNYTKFDGILYGGNDTTSHALAISGIARTLDLKSKNVTVSSYYTNNGKKVAPFALVHRYGSADGKIIYVNNAGYFDALIKSPKQFSSLGHVPAVLDLNTPNYAREYLPNTAENGSRFIGKLKASGPTTVTTRSLLLPNESNFTADNISISNASIVTNPGYKKNAVKNALIENLTLTGAYSAVVESTGVVSLPSWLSEYDYIGMSLPKTINLTLKILDKSGKVDFLAITSNNTGKYKVPITVGNKEEVRFHNIGPQNSSAASQILIMKKPEINASGNITVNNMYTPANEEERNVSLTGLNASIDHLDTLVINYKNTSRMQYVTYLNWLQTERIPEHKQIVIKLPGDISERSKNEGMEVPWKQVMVSKNGIILVTSVVSVSLVAIWRLRTRTSGS